MSLSILAAAQEAPELPALVDATRAWTYAELADAVRAEIARQRSRGLALPGAPRVAGVEVHLDARTVITLLALIETGTPFLPLHVQLGSAERRALEKLGGPLFDVGAPSPAESPCCPGPLERVADDERTLALVATSGSGGAPRLAKLSRSAFAAAARASREHLGWHGEERWLLCLPLAHVGGLSVLTRCLEGRSAVALSSGTSADQLAESFARLEPTLASLVPAMLDRLLARDPAWRPPRATRAILLGGAAAPRRLVERALERGIPLLPTYGMTETCAQVATALPGGDPQRLVPLPGFELRERGGRIEVRSPTLASCLLPPEADAEAWSPGGWFRTGDAGEIDESGALTLLGRADEIIVSGAEKIAPPEVEDALRECPGVGDALVFGVPDERWGEIVAAALLKSEEREVSDDTLRAALEGTLARYKRPRLVAWLDAFPLRGVGKTDRRAVIEQARSRLRKL